MYEMIKLPYEFSDFKGYMSEKTLNLHYNVLYKGYVTKYNAAMKKLEDARKNADFSNIKCLDKELIFQGAGATLHTLFFENITPLKKEPDAWLTNVLTHNFMSIDLFKNEFIASATNIEGSGWCVLGYNRYLDRLFITPIEKHQDLSIWDYDLLLIIDVWEHAYYLDYETDKKLYVQKMLDIINWKVVEKRLKRAMSY